MNDTKTPAKSDARFAATSLDEFVFPKAKPEAFAEDDGDAEKKN